MIPVIPEISGEEVLEMEDLGGAGFRHLRVVHVVHQTTHDTKKKRFENGSLS